jgi:hypothetical protein
VCPRAAVARLSKFVPSSSSGARLARAAAARVRGKEHPMRTLVLAAALALSAAASTATASDPVPPKHAEATAARCQHGVKKSICTRCNPKLEPVFKAKGDWCPEHARPESQCVLCNRSLAKEGVK